MIYDEVKKRITDLCNKPTGLGGWLGLPYEQDGCVKFVVRFYREMGIEADEDCLKQTRDFRRVEEPEFGDVAVFRGIEFEGGGFHIGVMLDRTMMIQCIPETNGVGKVDISRYPWEACLKGFYRHKNL